MAQAKSMPASKSVSSSTQKRAGSALSHEFTLQSRFNSGYRNREDTTILPPGVMITGSQNVLTNTSERLGVRKGYTRDGQANTDVAPILGSFDWERHTGNTRHLRSGFNTSGVNGKLQFRYVASTGQSWNGNAFTQDQIFWIDLMTSLTSINFNFADFWDFTNLQANLLFVNGTSSIFNWSGGVTTFASATNNAGEIATFHNPGEINTIVGLPTTGGFGYVIGDILVINTGGLNATVRVDTVNIGGVVTSVVLGNPGSGYAPGAGQGTTCIRGGAGCTINIGAVFGAAGAGYAVGDVLTATTAGVGGTFEVTSVVGGIISSIKLLTPGSGYGTGNTNTAGGTGAGAIINVTAIATASITKQGTTTWAEEGFYNAGTRSVTINGTVYSYTGGEATTTLVGVSPDPTLAGYGAGNVVYQTVRTVRNIETSGLPATFANSLIATLNNQVYIGSFENNSVYVSQTNSFTDYTFTEPVRKVNEGAIITLDGRPVAFTPQEKSMYISALKDQWYQTQFVLSSDLSSESLSIQRLKTTALQGTQSQAWTTKIKNYVAFLSFEPIINELGLVADILNFPQAVDLSYPIVNDMNNYDFTDGSMAYNKQFLYVAVPKENRMLVYNMTNPQNPYWEAPQIMPISRFSMIDGELYGHSYQVGETYKLFSGYNDNGNPINAVAKFSFNSQGIRASSKSCNEYFIDGYISPSTTLTFGIQYDLDGCSTNVAYNILGTDTQIVCGLSSDASLGKTSLGTNPLGGNLFIDTDPLPPYFHVVRTFPRVPFYFESPSFSSTGIDQQWEILSFGGAITPTSEGNNAITV